MKNTWTKLFVRLSCTSDNEVPTARAKINLSFSGLDEKKVVFQKDGKASHVLCVVCPSCSSRRGHSILSKSVLGQARGFIRPLLKDLSLHEQSAFQVILKNSMVT